jgi:hypothetical protein
MVGKTSSDKELIRLLDDKPFSKDEEGHLISIDFRLEELLKEAGTDKIDGIVAYIHNELSFLKEYGNEIEEIIYSPHLFTPSMVYVSFLKPIKKEFDWGEVLYARK